MEKTPGSSAGGFLVVQRQNPRELGDEFGRWTLRPQRPTGSASPHIVSRNSLGEHNRRFAHRQALGVCRAFQAEIRAKVIDKKGHCLTGVQVDPDLFVRRFLGRSLVGWL